MKDLIITVKRQKKELAILAFCLVAALVLNIAAVFIYKTQWRELYTQLHVVVLISFFLYMLTWVARLIFMGIRATWQTIKKK